MEKFLFVLLFMSSFSVQAGWTTTAAKISLLNPKDATTEWVRLEPSVSVGNPQSCTEHDNWFEISDMDTDKGKANWSLAMMAFAMGHKVTINSTQCVSSGQYNNVYRIRVNSEDN